MEIFPTEWPDCAAKHWERFWALSRVKVHKQQGRIRAAAQGVFCTCGPGGALERLPQLWITVREAARLTSLLQTSP